MGNIKAGQWILILLLYFFAYFMLVYSVSGLATYYKFNNGVSYTDPGFINIADDYVFYGGKCTSPSGISDNVLSNIGSLPGYTFQCSELTGLKDNQTCNAIHNCTWQDAQNISFTFTLNVFDIVQLPHPGRCEGSVDYTYYNITNFTTAIVPSFLGTKEIPVSKIYCENNSGLRTKRYCELFECTWMDSSELYQQKVSLLKPNGFLTQSYTTFKLMFGFRSDVLPVNSSLYFVFIFVFTYLPFVALLIAIYFALPFLHS